MTCEEHNGELQLSKDEDLYLYEMSTVGINNERSTDPERSSATRAHPSGIPAPKYNIRQMLKNVKGIDGKPYIDKNGMPNWGETVQQLEGPIDQDQYEEEKGNRVEYNQETDRLFNEPGQLLEQQKAQVRVQYEGTDQWLKSPNGKPTNLTEDQWVTVRTPAFKNWFGHWDLAAERAKLDKAVPVPVQENRVGATETEKPIANAIRQFNEMYPGGEVVPTVIGDVKINEESVSDSLSHKFSQAKLDAVLSLVEGMKTASYMGQMKDPTNKAKTNHYFVYKIKYGDGTRYVFVRGVQNFNNPAKLYVHEVYDEESIKKRSETISWPPDHEDQVQSRGIALYTSILNAFLNNVNSSKVVDENGEPLVVCHGTKKKFDTFEKQKIGTGVRS